MRFLAILIFLLAGCSSQTPIEICIGDKQGDVERNLELLGAQDISDGMSVGTIDGTDPRKDGPLRGWMWHIEKTNITIETAYSGGRLTQLNVWDWETQELDRYHHLLKYDEVSRLLIYNRSSKYETKIVKSHNE